MDVMHWKDNGEYAEPAYVKGRIVSHLRRYSSIPLSERRAVAERLVADRAYNGCVVSFLCRISLDAWVETQVQA
jgi:hypothetical protein